MKFPLRPSSTTRTLKLSVSENHLRVISDEDLVLACQNNIDGAFEHLYLRHERTISRMIHRLVPEWRGTDTSDLKQQVIMHVWQSIGALRNPQAFKAWLNQIVRNSVYDELRDRQKAYQLLSLDEQRISEDGKSVGMLDIIDSSPQPQYAALGNELAALLAESLASISSDSRTVVVLRDIEGLSYEEIAQITHLELGTVKSRIARGRGKVQRLLMPYLEMQTG